MKYSSIFKRALGLSLIVGFLCVGAVGCESDDDNGGNNSGTGGASGTGGTGGASAAGGTGGASGTGGTGGASGTGGTGGGGGTGGMAPPMPMMCDTTTCNPVPTATGAMLPPCCAATTTCGAIADATTMACVGVGQEGEEDDECQGEMNVLNQTTPGCCQPDGDCGLLSATLMGCVERTEYPSAFLLSMMPLTDATTCTPDGDDDAGM